MKHLKYFETYAEYKEYYKSGKMGLNMETDEVTLPEFFEGVSKEHGHEIMADIYKKMKEKEEKEKEKSVKKIQKPFLFEKATILKEFDKIKKKK